jgi:hypothetical protein
MNLHICKVAEFGSIVTSYWLSRNSMYLVVTIELARRSVYPKGCDDGLNASCSAFHLALIYFIVYLNTEQSLLQLLIVCRGYYTDGVSTHQMYLGF